MSWFSGRGQRFRQGVRSDAVGSIRSRRARDGCIAWPIPKHLDHRLPFTTALIPVILSPVSLTEFPAYWCEHPTLFASISGGVNEQDRMERVLRWFIMTLKGQYTVSAAARIATTLVRCCDFNYSSLLMRGCLRKSQADRQTRNEKMGSEKKVSDVTLALLWGGSNSRLAPQPRPWRTILRSLA